MNSCVEVRFCLFIRKDYVVDGMFFCIGLKISGCFSALNFDLATVKKQFLILLKSVLTESSLLEYGVLVL